MAAVFKVFGAYSGVSAWMLLAIDSVFSAATALATWEIGHRMFSRQNAVWAGWLWALYPAAMQYSVRSFWEMSLTACLFTWVIVLALRMRGIGAAQQQERSSQTRQWLLFGLLWGVIALSTSTLLLLLPVCGLWILLGTRHRLHALRNAVLAALVFLACLAPWEARNYRVFHAFIPIRGNLGVESYLGNGPGSRGFVMAYDHPSFASDQLRLYVALGEVGYSRLRGDMARAYIRAHPAHFAVNTLKRFYFFWISVPSDARWELELPRVLNYCLISLSGLLGLGLALVRRVPASGLIAWAFVLLPLPYYFVFVEARFRHPLEPLMAVLGVYLFQSAAARQPVFLNRTR
jgi:4-amino-4-deoxy-L-arabinose transferase-like glycosyltransferase